MLDVWSLHTPGGPDDLPRLAQLIAASDGTLLARPAVRALFLVRLKLGEIVARRPTTQPSTPPWSLLHRLPDDLLHGERGPDVVTMVPFPSVYLTDVEWVAECSTRLVHMIQHIGWVRDDMGGYSAQLATLVRPANVTGRIYMRAISPFRRFIVGPALVKTTARDWRRANGRPPEQVEKGEPNSDPSKPGR